MNASRDQEITVRVGSFRVHFYPIEGGMSCETFLPRHNGHPQGDWLVADTDDEFDTPDGREAIRRADACSTGRETGPLGSWPN